MSAPPTPPSQALVLRDIHLPPSPPWWPPAPGWWVLAALLVIAFLAIFFIARARRRRRVWRDQLLAEIDVMANQYADDALFAASLHQFLRRVARRYEQAASRQGGDPWRTTLARVPVDSATLDALMTLEPRMYRPGAEFDRHVVRGAAHRWVEKALQGIAKTDGGSRHA